MAFNREQPAHVRFRALAAERTSPLVAWIGSGLSVPAGLPTWSALRAILVAEARRKIETLDHDSHQRQKGKVDTSASVADYWLAFDLLRSVLGATTYRQVIREVLGPASTAAVPHAYSQLWRLRLNGIINLNLDRLATKALTKQRPGIAPLEFTGHQVATWMHVLKSPHPFIINIHGITEDVSSWIFTRDDLKALFETPGYNDFLVSCLATRTVLFVGLSTDDVAVGGHLERLASRGVETGPHYWLTSRTDAETDAWAERVGVSVIRHDPDGNSQGAIDEFFDDILGYVPADDLAQPVTIPVPAVDALPSPAELRREDAETIRKLLNAKASEILSGGTEEEYAQYERFFREYNEAVYRAWYVGEEEGANELLGYRLMRRAGGGAFGTVYEAVDLTGETVAVKVLHEEVRRTPEMLQSFRRGVRSMKILTGANLEGIVKYRAASEIPAFVVMDWVNGPNLRQVIQAKKISTWPEILDVAVRLAHIIRSAHMLPDRVLHRDLRPANIMLDDYWSDETDWRLVVLDFDLSYHVGAHEKTIDLRGEAATGYLAPEQLQRMPGVSTRNAAVDSFGIGMTLYYLVARRDPIPAEHMHSDWHAKVFQACRLHDFRRWLSLSNRVARTILFATRNKQAERWDVAQIEGELSRLQQLLLRPSAIPPVELIAEELMARAAKDLNYTWRHDSFEARLELISGVSLGITANEAQESLKLTVDWASSGDQSRKAVMKWLPDAANGAAAMLKADGWYIENASAYAQAVHLSASLSADHAFRKLDKTASVVAGVAKKLTFA